MAGQRMLTAVLGLGAVALLVGCGSSSAKPPGDAPPIHDAGIDAPALPADAPAGPPTLELYHYDVNGHDVLTQPNDAVPLVVPEQGGYVMFIEPHIQNMAIKSIQLKTSLTDPCDGSVVTFESRPATFKPGSDGFYIPISQSSDGVVSMCPATGGSSRDLYNKGYTLDVLATDGNGATAEQTVQIVPTCTDPTCVCECSKSYIDGQQCPNNPDAGVVMTTCP